FNIYEETYQDKTKYLKKSMKDIEIKIKALVQSLSQTKETAAEHYILQEINELDEKKQLLQNQIQEIENISENDALTDTDLENLIDILISFSKSFDCMALNQKRTAIRTFIYKIIWDGADIHIYFFDSDKSLTTKAAG
ncbi:MAG: recombinase family protein, partial [Oscillospiraceae bacterium]|nr:recombinase family protein [Oscillospiraceae bacterium]